MARSPAGVQVELRRPEDRNRAQNLIAASAPESVQVGPAISYALGQGATLVAALWGLLIWHEFREAPPGTPAYEVVLAASALGTLTVGGNLKGGDNTGGFVYYPSKSEFGNTTTKSGSTRASTSSSGWV